LWPEVTPLPTTPAVSPNGASGDEKPEIPSVAEIHVHGATGRDVGPVLERIAALHDSLGNAVRELSRILQNQLAVPTERALMSDVANKTLLTTEDVAAKLSVDTRTVRRWRKAGKIPRGIEVSGVLRWTPESIDAWIAAGGHG
jgi:predicted DNA-binding transcriptional regulator AlpA